MPQYVFYPEKLDGCPTTLEIHDVAEEAEAFVRAEMVLDQHRSSSSVAVWLNDRMVFTLYRNAPALRHRSVEALRAV